MNPKWSLGGAKVDQKWTKVGPRARSGTTCEKRVPQNRFWSDFGVDFEGHVGAKKETKNMSSKKAFGNPISIKTVVSVRLANTHRGFSNTHSGGKP